MRILAVATLFGMLAFHGMVALAVLHYMGRIEFLPTDVDVAVTLGVYVVGLAALIIADHSHGDEPTHSRG